MNRHVALDPAAVDLLIASAAGFTGFSREAILPEAVRRAAVALLQAQPSWSVADLLRRAQARSPEVVHALCQAVSVGETFFFRHPEQFRFLESTVIPALLRAGRPVIRAWSAGCASGEEAFSLAACLLAATAGTGVDVSVLGTDLLARNVASARAGTYGLWSQRPSGPLLHRLFHPSSPDHVTIDDRVREVTRFELHNLLEPMPQRFEIIFCRNVLVYFAPEPARTATAHLAAALLPGGALAFGSMDVGAPPPGLVRAGLPELQIFRHPEPRAAAPHPKPAAPKAPAPPPSGAPAPPEPVALHLKALVHIERGDKQIAEEALKELTTRVPDYVPGILERALLHGRQGQRSTATSLMREVLRRTEKLPSDAVLSGPEPLPVQFYRDSASTFLNRAGE